MKAFRYTLLLTCFILSMYYTVVGQESRKIEIVSAGSMEYDQDIGDRAMRLIGNVVLKHEEAYMYCDSGYLYRETNSFKAFSNVKIIQGDSLLLTGSTLDYYGNTKMAEMRDTVVLKHYNSYLETDSLNYDRTEDMGYYFGGGEIFDVENQLYSKRGYYFTNDKDYFAVDSVVFVNPQYKMYSDTLKYNTDTEISFFFGPTQIISDSNYIYCENGFYDTKKDLSAFSENSYLQNGSQTLKGDSLFYDRNIRMGEAFVNVSVIDTAENFIANGNYAIYFESPQHAMLVDSVLVTYVSDGDSIFMNADTVLIDVDSADNKLIRAYRHVQAFKSDAQVRCDSLVYNSADSISELFGKPVIWAEGNQLSSDKMELHFVNKKAHHINMKGYAFIVNREDEVHFSQIKGRDLVSYFKDNDIYRVDIFNDSQTLYYVRDEETEELIGLNKVVCDDMIIYRNNKQIDKIMFYDKPDGNLTPIEQLNPDNSFLLGFRWLDEFRPKSKYDIFHWTPLD